MPTPDQSRILRWEAWRELHAERLERYHLDVANEIAGTVRERYLAGNFAPMTDQDRCHCLMRVASRVRVRQGPAGDLRAIVEELGGRA